MSQDLMREKFEAWAAEFEFDLRPECDLHPDFGDAYISGATENVWRCWQAAYAAAVEDAARVAGPEDSYVDEWFRAKAHAVARIRCLAPERHRQPAIPSPGSVDGGSNG